MGLPECEVGGPGGGGIGLPECEVGAPPGAAASARVGPPADGAGGRGAPPDGGAGRPGGGAAGRGGRAAAGRSGVRGGRGVSVGAAAPADAAGRAAPGSSSRREGRGGCSLPEDVTRRPGGGGGVGRPAVRCGGAAGGIDGRGTQLSSAGRDPASGDGGDGFAARAGVSAAGAASAAGSDALGWAGGASGLVGDPALGARAWALVSAPVSALPPPLAGFSSGCSARTSPSRVARRRTRSACASSMPEECVLTPMPRSFERSRVSLFVIPSSLASSWTRIFAAKVVSDQPFVFLWARTAHVVVRIAALHPRADDCPGTNSDHETLCFSACRAADQPHGTLGRTLRDGQPPPDMRREWLYRARLRVQAVYGPRPAIRRPRARSGPAPIAGLCGGNRCRSAPARRSDYPSSPGFSSPGLSSPGLSSPGITSPGVSSPGVSSPGSTSPGSTSPGV